MSNVFDIADSSDNLSSETVSHVEPKVWNFKPNECKMSTTFGEFKVNIMKWVHENCPCTQPAITWSKLSIETLEQGVKYIQI